jgi:hypothetical protein
MAMVGPGRSRPLPAVPFLHCARVGVVGDMAGQPTTASEDKAGDSSYVWNGLGQSLELEVVKRAVEISIGLRKVSDWTLWRAWLPPKRKERRRKHVPRKRRNGGAPVGYSGRIALRREHCMYTVGCRCWMRQPRVNLLYSYLLSLCRTYRRTAAW